MRIRVPMSTFMISDNEWQDVKKGKLKEVDRKGVKVDNSARKPIGEAMIPLTVF